MNPYLALLFGLLSLIGFILMYLDKHRAISHQWRIEEKTFYMLGFLGGALGIWVGMLVFRHKTRKFVFNGVLLLALIANSIMIYVVR
jgi:uncharacterized membrane protein YsdA (DUF1294 family)